MIKERRIRNLAILSLAALLACGLGCLGLEWLLPSFPGFLFGQIQLTRDSAPLPPQAYQSSEFLLGQVDAGEIVQASYLHLQDDVLFWDPYYPGFPRADLSLEEVRQIQAFLAGGELIKEESGEIACLEPSPAGDPDFSSCPEGEKLWEQYNQLRFQAQRDREVGLLLVELRGGRAAEIRIWPGAGGTAFEPYEKGGPWWFAGVAPGPFPLLEELAARAVAEPAPALWPRLTADRANARAERILGSPYRRALEAVLGSSQVREAFGEVLEIRPALGSNTRSSWMDSSSATVTLSLVGTAGEGAVLARGEDCFQLQMVVNGVPVAGRYRDQCP